MAELEDRQRALEARQAEFWKQRYDTQHRTVHRLEARCESYRTKLGTLLSALDRLDLTDDYTLEHASALEVLNCARPAESWREVREAYDAARAALAVPQEGKPR